MNSEPSTTNPPFSVIFNETFRLTKADTGTGIEFRLDELINGVWENWLPWTSDRATFVKQLNEILSWSAEEMAEYRKYSLGIA